MTPAPETCPVCSSGLKSHTPETPDDYEAWEFYCYAIILRMENGKLTAESDCNNATRMAVAALNDRASDALQQHSGSGK